MKVPALMRKRFEDEYPHNSKLAACEWCVLYHCYRVKPNPSRKPGNTGAKDEQAVAGLLSAFMQKKAREAFEAIHPVPEGFIWDPHSGYVGLMIPSRPADWQDIAEGIDATLKAFEAGYVEMFETIYYEEVGL